MCTRSIQLLRQQGPCHLDSKKDTPSATSSRKRVRFAGGNRTSAQDDSAVSAKRQRLSSCSFTILEYLPLSSELTLQEKQERWVQQSEHQAMRLQANIQAVQQQQQHQENTLSKAQVFTHIYTLCQSQPHLSSSSRDEKTLAHEQLLPQLVQVMTEQQQQLGQESSRGLEDRMVPWLGLERRLIRHKAIQAVVKAQNTANQHSQQHNMHNQAQRLCNTSRYYSHSARQLGHVMGVVDAAVAMAEQQQSCLAESTTQDAFLVPEEGSPTTSCAAA